MKAKLLAAKRDVEAGKRKWADVVKEYATDAAPKYNAGDLGWRSRENTSLGKNELNAAVKDLKPGQISEPVLVADKGAYMFLVEAERQGDLTFDQVKFEIAEKLAREAWAKEKAKREALAALAKATEGTGTPLEKLFELDVKLPGQDFDMEYFQDPTVPQEEKERLLRRLQRRGELDRPVVFEGKDVPAASKAQAGGSSAAAGSATPAAGSAPAPAGSAPAPAAGSAPAAPGSAAPPPPAKPAAPAEITPSTDPLPEFEKYAPKAVRHMDQMRRTSLPGLGKHAKVLFEDLRNGQVAKRVYEHNGQYIVFQMVKKGEPTEADFTKEAEKFTEELRTARERVVIEDFLRSRCETLVKEKKLTAYRGDEHDDNGNVTKKFTPCFSFQSAAPRGIPGVGEPPPPPPQ
jgi:hypothetical protein